MDGETDRACAWVCGGVAYWQSRRPECWTARPLPRSRWLPQRPPPRAAPDPRRVALQEGRDLTVGEWARGEGGSGEGGPLVNGKFNDRLRISIIVSNYMLEENWPVLDTPTTLLLSLIRSSMTAITRNSYQDSCAQKHSRLFNQVAKLFH